MTQELSKQLQQYIDNTLQIRELSSPQIEEVEDPEDYRLVLLENFRRIGTLALENNRILQTVYYPLLERKELLTEEETEALKEFRKAHLNAYSMENLDLPLMWRQTKKLLADAKERGSDHDIIGMIDRFIEVCFAMLHQTERVQPVNPAGIRYRNEGLAEGEVLLSYLPKEAFAKLSEADRETVLVNARYISALFARNAEVGDDMERVNEEDLAFLRRALALADDPFYREAVPEYNWVYHTFRTLQYLSQLVHNGNERGYSEAQCKEIYDYTARLYAFWDKERSALQKYTTDAMMTFAYARAAYCAGASDAESYRRALIGLYENIDDRNYSFFNNSRITLIPMELTKLAEKEGLRPQDAGEVETYYERLITYLHRIPKKGSFSFLLSYLTILLSHYIEVPGGMDFETFCLRLTAALHPPTYVHVRSVAAFSVCLVRHLIRKDPAQLTGVLDCETAEDVKRNEQKIIDFTEHAALCHDIGKLFVTEVIMTYGRTLLDEEFELIKTHPGMGALMLEKHEDTKPYVNVALMHHKWYDNTGGYPAEHSFEGMKDKAVISVVTVADCLDASTDAVGRSYKTGKTLEDYIGELREGRGTRYAPYVVDLFEDEAVQADLTRILTEGRDENYREAYRILKSYRAPES
ncbi:MAG: HD domain-containing protein [Lachnospiraceae bacterium]|nr:HD domain-containing protein [Lachnospiraceae bacterium]